MLPLLHLGHRTSVGLQSWQFDPPVIIGLIGLSALYLWIISPTQRVHYAGAEPVPPIRIASFVGGMLAFAVALLSPLEPLSDSFLFSAHMVQHILITIVGPPLILLGLPRWMVEAIARGAGRAWSIWRFLTRPLIAFALFNLTFAFVHFPAFYNLALRDQNVHILEHILLWSTAFIGWWPVLAPARELGELSRPLKGLYLLACTIPGQIVGAILTFSTTVIYDEYIHANRVWGLSPLTDQQIGGLIMWVLVGAFFLAAAMVPFGRWASDQTAADRERLNAARARSQAAR